MIAVRRRVEVRALLRPCEVRFLAQQYARHQVIDPSVRSGLSLGEYWAAGMEAANEASNPDKAVHFADELRRLRERAPATLERLERDRMRQMVLDGGSPAVTLDDVLLRAAEEYLDRREGVGRVDLSDLARLLNCPTSEATERAMRLASTYLRLSKLT